MTGVQYEIEDNYLDYLDDELGYAWGVWDRIPLAQIRRHDEVLESSLDELGNLDVAALDDLDRLAYARAARRYADTEGELAALRLIANAPMDHPGVAYAEAFGRLVRVLAENEDFDEALMMLDRLDEQEWSAEGNTSFLRCWLDFLQDRSKGRGAFEELLKEFPEDPELRYDIAEEFGALAERELALELLTEVEEVARETGLDAVLVDAELLRLSLTE